jgi:hypothetical protein
MGTEYDLYKDERFGELTISEMSNELELIFDSFSSNHEGHIYCSKSMSPEKLAKILLYGIQICSYWMDTDELKKMISDHVEKNIY